MKYKKIRQSTIIVRHLICTHSRVEEMQASTSRSTAKYKFSLRIREIAMLPM